MNNHTRPPTAAYIMHIEDYPSIDCVQTWFSDWQFIIFKYTLSNYAISFWAMYDSRHVVNMVKLTAYGSCVNNTHTESYLVSRGRVNRGHYRSLGGVALQADLCYPLFLNYDYLDVLLSTCVAHNRKILRLI